MEPNFSPIVLDRKSSVIFTGWDVTSLKQEILIYISTIDSFRSKTLHYSTSVWRDWDRSCHCFFFF